MMSAADQLKQLVEEVLRRLDSAGEVVVESAERGFAVRIKVDDPALLIGRAGETLEALQTIIRLLAYQLNLGESRIVIDINDYRSGKEESLAEFVREVAERVKSTGTPETLRPMTSYERRIVHQVITDLGGLSSESSGFGPDRRITIKLVD